MTLLLVHKYRLLALHHGQERYVTLNLKLDL